MAVRARNKSIKRVTVSLIMLDISGTKVCNCACSILSIPSKVANCCNSLLSNCAGADVCPDEDGATAGTSGTGVSTKAGVTEAALGEAGSNPDADGGVEIPSKLSISSCLLKRLTQQKDYLLVYSEQVAE